MYAMDEYANVYAHVLLMYENAMIDVRWINAMYELIYAYNGCTCLWI